ncbi:hypothetical protein DDE20_16710 [Pararhodobacter oceanensis]|uniref:HTH marR-type domain-containing protein n=1 Tax=Pararhodobacter oceanensis TaxID=2172121 RepID=A0A2T8HQ54_9RHOB|nr:hypothetical protein DDE20_16710 [Pararhodobacter oceanensis]
MPAQCYTCRDKAISGEIVMAMTAKQLELQLERVKKLESNVTFQFGNVAKLMELDAIEHLQGSDLNLTAFRVLRTVETFERISMADLARHMVTDNAQISRTASNLRSRGLVEFESDPGNQRRKMVVLTEAGRVKLGEVDIRFKARQDAVRACLGDDLCNALTECFERLRVHFAR